MVAPDHKGNPNVKVKGEKKQRCIICSIDNAVIVPIGSGQLWYLGRILLGFEKPRHIPNQL